MKIEEQRLLIAAARKMKIDFAHSDVANAHIIKTKLNIRELKEKPTSLWIDEAAGGDSLKEFKLLFIELATQRLTGEIS